MASTRDKAAFPKSNYIDINNLVLPYWLLNSDELQELFIDTDANDHNQRNVFKEAVVSSRKEHFKGSEQLKNKIHFDSPLYFDMEEVLQFAKSKNEEMVPGSNGKPKQGPLYGQLSNFINRLENKLSDKRLEFLFGDKAKNTTLEDTLKQLIGYSSVQSNITVLDLSGIPFEVFCLNLGIITKKRESNMIILITSHCCWYMRKPISMFRIVIWQSIGHQKNQ